MIVWLVVLVLVGRATSDVRSTNLCVLNDVKNAEKMKMMNEINLLNNERFVVTSNDYTYVVTMCNSASKEAEGNANVIRTKVPEHNVTVLGRYNNTDIVGRDEWRIMTFADGDVIRESSTCNGTKWKTLVILTCDPDVSVLELIDPLNVGCVSIFLLKTSIVCHPSQSIGVIIFYLVLVLILCYFLIGMAYKRFVTGAKGLEQIPNYNFWRDPTAWAQDLIGKQERRSEPWQRVSADAADEPLLHP